MVCLACLITIIKKSTVSFVPNKINQTLVLLVLLSLRMFVYKDICILFKMQSKITLYCKTYLVFIA